MWPVMGKERMIDGWEIRPVEGNYLRKVIPADEVIEFKGKNPVSKIDGFSTLTAVSQWADIQYATDRGKWHAYKNGTFPTVAVQFDGDMNDPTDQDLVRIEQKFLARYAGESRSNRPLFLPPGVQVKPLVIKPNEMMFGDTSREMRDNILAAFGVPVELIDLQGNTLHAESAFYNQTVNPLCHWLGCVLTEKLARRYPQDDGRLKIWWERFTADDPHLENENIKVDLLCGAVTPNERRISRGKQPYSGEFEEFGNTPLIPVNVSAGALPFGGEHEPGDNNDPPSTEQPLLNDDDYK
jgi:HK97 family phage portal protein